MIASAAHWSGAELDPSLPGSRAAIGIDRKPGANRGAGCVIDLVDQARCQLDELALFVRRMSGGLHIEIGQHAQQGRPDVDALAARERHQPVEPGNSGDAVMSGYATRKMSRRETYAPRL